MCLWRGLLSGRQFQSSFITLAPWRKKQSKESESSKSHNHKETKPAEVKALIFSLNIVKAPPAYKRFSWVSNLIQWPCVFLLLGGGAGWACRGAKRRVEFAVLVLLQVSTGYHGSTIISVRCGLCSSSQITDSQSGELMYMKHLVKTKYWTVWYWLFQSNTDKGQISVNFYLGEGFLDCVTSGMIKDEKELIKKNAEERLWTKIQNELPGQQTYALEAETSYNKVEYESKRLKKSVQLTHRNPCKIF